MNLKDKLLWFWHPALGAFTALLLFLHPVASVMMFAGYMLYEKQEYREDLDTCAIDIRDFMIGWGVTAFIALIVKISL